MMIEEFNNELKVKININTKDNVNLDNFDPITKPLLSLLKKTKFI